MISQAFQYLGIAFMSSIVILLLSWLMQTVLRRPADYYSAEEIWLEEPLYGTMWQARPGTDKKSEEDLDEIRKMLEQAYADQTAQEQPEEPAEEPAPAIPAEPEPEVTPAEEPAPEHHIPVTKSGRPRKPSMKMKKAELTEIAENMGIEIPEKATKQIILDLIREHQ